MVSIFRFLSYVIIISIIISCGHLPSKKSRNINKKIVNKHESKNSAKKYKDEIDKSLDKAIDSLKKKNPQLVKYFANEIYLKASAASIYGDQLLSNVLFEKLASLEPNDIFLQKRYILSLLKINKIKESKTAIIKLIKFIEKKPRNNYYFKDYYSLKLLLGGIYVAQLEKNKSRKTYQEIINSISKNKLKSKKDIDVVTYKSPYKDACVFLSKSYGKDEKYKKAFKVIQNCRKKLKNEASFYYYEAKLLINQEKYKQAINKLNKSLTIDEMFARSYFDLGLLYQNDNKVKNAEKIYIEFLEKFDGMGGLVSTNQYQLVLFKLVNIYLELGKYKKALPYMIRLANDNKDNLNLQVKLGVVLTDLKKFKEAKAVFIKILKKAPKSDKILYYLGALTQEIGELESSIKYLKKIESDSSLYRDSILQVAKMYSDLSIKEYNKGLANKKDFKEDFFKYVEVNTKKHPSMIVELTLLKAIYYESIKDYNSAINILEMISFRKDFTHVHFYYLASIYEKIKNYKKSSEIASSIVKQDPRNAHAWNFLGYSLIERGENLNLAYKYIKKALSLSPKDGFILDSLGWYYYKTGKIKTALKYILRAKKIVKNDVSISKHLAFIYKELKNYKKAKKYFSEALKLSQYEHEKKEILIKMSEIKALLNDRKKKRKPASKNKK
jgi:tetratricopeptide (TPR) repeat protein